MLFFFKLLLFSILFSWYEINGMQQTGTLKRGPRRNHPHSGKKSETDCEFALKSPFTGLVTKQQNKFPHVL